MILMPVRSRVGDRKRATPARWSSRPFGRVGRLAAILLVSVVMGCRVHSSPRRWSSPSTRCVAASAQALTQSSAASDPKVATWRARLAELESRDVHVGYVELPDASLDDVPALASLIPEFSFAGSVLAQDEGLSLRALPVVLRHFRESLEVRLDDIQASVLPRHRLDRLGLLATVNTRLGALRVFSALGPAASSAMPDMLLLLRRSALEDEYAGPMSTLDHAIAKVFWENPETLLEMASGEEALPIRRKVLYAMGLMRDEAAPRVAPALLALLERAEPELAADAATALGHLGWYREEFLAGARARLARMEGPDFAREQLERTVRMLERKLEQDEGP